MISVRCVDARDRPPASGGVGPKVFGDSGTQGREAAEGVRRARAPAFLVVDIHSLTQIRITQNDLFQDNYKPFQLGFILTNGFVRSFRLWHPLMKFLTCKALS